MTAAVVTLRSGGTLHCPGWDGIIGGGPTDEERKLHRALDLAEAMLGTESFSQRVERVYCEVHFDTWVNKLDEQLREAREVR